ncbi:MAG: nucleotidyltransferase [Lachnospiraceae bacterium]|nr:nucleotidyltransferase [Lachnospiraceae bacterium]
MKVTAVIAEYNPFHNGHLYQLGTIRQTLNTDIIIVVMSGDFMQRGIPAISDKYERCRMALENGADLVFELPVYFALGSAEYFAQGAVSLVDKLGVVDFLHFGSESGDISFLYEFTSMMLAHESDAYKSTLNKYLKLGCSFPAARDNALSELLPDQKIKQLVSAPNNILGVEYVKALIQRNSAIKPVTLARKGEGYSSDSLVTGSFASANAIRKALVHQSDTDRFAAQNTGLNQLCVKDHVPVSVYALLHQNGLLYANDFSEILLYKMLQAARHKDAFAGYYDIGEQLSHTLYNNLPQYTTLEAFALLCKTRNLTYTRICRGLMHILLEMTQENADTLKYNDYAQYARLLGFTERGKQLLKSIKANTSIPVITKPSSALKQLSGTALMSLRSDIHAADIYDSVRQQKRIRLSDKAAEIVRHNELTSQIIKC